MIVCAPMYELVMWQWGMENRLKELDFVPDGYKFAV